MNPTQDKSRFCPKCSSSLVDFSPLEGGWAQCAACLWKGSKSDLNVHHFKHESGSEDEILHTFLVEFKNIFARDFAKPLAALLYKWGFFAGEPTPKELTRYMSAMAQASVDALIAMRGKMEKERANNGN